jgi:hypothetical protein
MAKVPWQTIAAKLPEYDEATLERMLDDEINKHKRVAIARRLHQRLSKLRVMRERDEIMKRIGA